MAAEIDTNNLLESLIERINTHLSLCDESETPVICGMLDDQESKEMLINLIVKKVVDEQYDIATAVIAINNEFDPNSLD